MLKTPKASLINLGGELLFSNCFLCFDSSVEKGSQLRLATWPVFSTIAGSEKTVVLRCERKLGVVMEVELNKKKRGREGEKTETA